MGTSAVRWLFEVVAMQGEGWQEGGYIALDGLDDVAELGGADASLTIGPQARTTENHGYELE